MTGNAHVNFDFSTQPIYVFAAQPGSTGHLLTTLETLFASKNGGSTRVWWRMT